MKTKEVISSKINFILVLIFSIMPICMSVLDIDIAKFILYWSIIYLIFFSLSLLAFRLKGGKLNFTIKKTLTNLFILVLSIWIILSSVINDINIHTLLYLSLVLEFIAFFKLDRRQMKIVLLCLISSVAISCIMGFIDPYNEIFPGFNKTSRPLSIHFSHPNNSGMIVSVFAILSFILFAYKKELKLKVFYLICYLIFATHLFMNGSFVPISSGIIVEIFTIVFLKIKNKKLD